MILAIRLFPIVGLLLLLNGSLFVSSQAVENAVRETQSGFRMEGVNLSYIERTQQVGALKLDIRRLVLPQLISPLEDVAIICGNTRLSPMVLSCDDGQFSFSSGKGSSAIGKLAFRYRPDNSFELDLHELVLAGGSISGTLKYNRDDWSGQINGRNVDVKQLLNWIGNISLIDAYKPAGKMSIKAVFAGDRQGLKNVNVDFAATALAFSDVASTRVGENIGLSVKLNAERSDRGLRYAVAGNLNAGQLLIDPVFIDLKESPINIQSSGAWKQSNGLLTVDDLRYAHRDVLNLAGSGMFHLGGDTSIDQLTVKFDGADLANLYGVYLQPAAIGSAFGELMISGRASARFQIRDSVIEEARLKLFTTDIDDLSQRFGFKGLNLDFGWSASARGEHSSLTFDSAALYGIDLGRAQVEFVTLGQQLSLSQAARIPLLDGELVLQSFELQGLGQPSQQWGLDAEIKPVGLPALSRAFGWTELSGTLAGSIPDVHYSNGNIEVGGALLVDVFDGEIAIRELQLKDILGVAPVLHGNINLENLDLKAITETFSFGGIEGKLSGSVEDLELVNWVPTRFDATLATPDDDRSRHKISQRAIDNLTKVGNGVSGAISNSFLRFFKQFSYDRIGLSCRLRGAVCEMSGVEEVTDGYYIVKGKGLPRIDVVGHTRQVAWRDLIERVQGTNFEASPVIQ